MSIPTNAKRDQLEKLLHDTVEEQGCCYGNDCICYRNGIGCQLDTCSCWHTSHSHSGSSSGNSNDDVPPPNDQVLARCGNKFGCYIVDFNEIAMHRKKFINANATKKGICGDCHV